MRLTVTDARGVDLAPYIRMLEEIGDAELARYDREEAGRACNRGSELDCPPELTFAGLSRPEQAQIVEALARMGRTKRVNLKTPTSYGLKHIIEREIGTYTTNLQVKVAARVLGLESDGAPLNKRYNLSAAAVEDVCAELGHRRSYRGRDGSGVDMALSVRIGEGGLAIAEFAPWWESGGE